MQLESAFYHSPMEDDLCDPLRSLRLCGKSNVLDALSDFAFAFRAGGDKWADHGGSRPTGFASGIAAPETGISSGLRLQPENRN
jgi:hypothetical protein